jgi:hypothetical protein
MTIAKHTAGIKELAAKLPMLARRAIVEDLCEHLAIESGARLTSQERADIRETARVMFEAEAAAIVAAEAAQQLAALNADTAAEDAEHATSDG